MSYIFSNDKQFLMINEAIKANRFNNNLLVISKDEETASVFAKEVINSAFCKTHSNCGVCEGCVKTEKGTNPDLLIYPKEKSFQVEDAKDIIETSLLKPMIFDKKFYLVLNIDNSTISAQNKILKILEEPPADVLFVLTATNESKILPTIKSRCNKITVSSIDREILKNYFGENENKFDLAYQFGEGYIGETRFALQHKNFEDLNALAESIINDLKTSKEVISYSSKICKDKEQFQIVLKLLLLKFAKLINSGNINYNNLCLTKIIEEITLAKKQIENNVNINLIADNLLMKILELKYLYRG